ncbi:MAG: sugar phosphate nucleotidyltransferase, partial [Proteobacteria bacterium]|nr:sugar phosphate nucleotidyltransferase [Pseudomonadota bacterium]
QYGVEEAIEAGMTDIGVISGRGKRAIEDHFDISYELEHQIAGSSKEALLDDIRRIIDTCSFSYTRQVEMKGLGHAILTGERLVGDHPFGVILSDDYCINEEGPGVLAQMVKLFNEYQCTIVAIEEVPADETYKYGVIEGKEIQDGLFKLSNMVEKPKPEEAPSNLAIIGRYILTPDIFDIIRATPPGANGEMQITDSINIQAQKRMVLGYKFKGRRFDCGSLDGFVEATNYVYDRIKSAK